MGSTASQGFIFHGGHKINRLYMVGARGAGKSTVGQLLAEQLQWRFFDTDDEIERRTGQSIADLFSKMGEPAFRTLESDMLQECNSLSVNVVVATGGGIILSDANRGFLRLTGTVVWLRAPATVLHSRMAGDRLTVARRPNLTHSGGLAEVELVLAQREPLYHEVAKFVIDTTALSPNEVVSAILAAC